MELPARAQVLKTIADRKSNIAILASAPLVDRHIKTAYATSGNSSRSLAR
jgi:hypothetical protein